jgi:hypothetical protein
MRRRFRPCLRSNCLEPRYLLDGSLSPDYGSDPQPEPPPSYSSGPQVNPEVEAVSVGLDTDEIDFEQNVNVSFGTTEVALAGMNDPDRQMEILEIETTRKAVNISVSAKLTETQLRINRLNRLIANTQANLANLEVMKDVFPDDATIPPLIQKAQADIARYQASLRSMQQRSGTLNWWKGKINSALDWIEGSIQQSTSNYVAWDGSVGTMTYYQSGELFDSFA